MCGSVQPVCMQCRLFGRNNDSTRFNWIYPIYHNCASLNWMLFNLNICELVQLCLIYLYESLPSLFRLLDDMLRMHYQPKMCLLRISTRSFWFPHRKKNEPSLALFGCGNKIIMLVYSIINVDGRLFRNDLFWLMHH